MANQGRSSGQGTPKRRNRAAPAQRLPPRKPPRKTADVVFDTPAEEPHIFRLGAVPGTTPAKWIDTWKQRMPHVPLELVPIRVSDQRSALDELDAALVRLPLADPSLHFITLYDEVPLVVAGVDSHLMAADELSIADLAGETVMIPSDDALEPFDMPGALRPPFPSLSTEDAIATAASGTSAVVVPMSLARLHHRKDADHRPLAGAPVSTVALAWPRERTTPDVETFIGILLGRTPNSSR